MSLPTEPATCDLQPDLDTMEDSDRRQDDDHNDRSYDNHDPRLQPR